MPYHPDSAKSHCPLTISKAMLSMEKKKDTQQHTEGQLYSFLIDLVCETLQSTCLLALSLTSHYHVIPMPEDNGPTLLPQCT